MKRGNVIWTKNPKSKLQSIFPSRFRGVPNVPNHGVTFLEPNWPVGKGVLRVLGSGVRVVGDLVETKAKVLYSNGQGWVMGRLARCAVQLGGGGGGRTGVTHSVLSLTFWTAHPLWTD